MAAGPSRRSRGSLTAWSLAALGAGLALGVLGHASGAPALRWLAEAALPFGDLWLSALQMTVIPLVIAYTLAAIVGARQEGLVGPLALRSILLFLAMLLGAGILAMIVSPLAVRLHAIDPATVDAVRGQIRVPEEARQAAAGGGDSLRDLIGGLLPRNILEAAVRGDIFPLLLFAIVFGLAITRLPDGEREPLSRIFRGLASAMLVCVRWVLILMPLGVFVFAYEFAFAAGGGGIEVLGVYVGSAAGVMLLCTVLLYPLTAALGRVSVRDFARAVAPAQMIAVTTRSSIASLPALIQGARERLRLPDSATGLVLPLSVSVFKLDISVSNMVKLFFLAQVYGVHVGVARLVAFLLFVTALSFSSPGLPSGGSFRTLPAYLAAGVPIEGVVMVQAMEAIPDVFMTLLNVTGDMSAAALLSRAGRARRTAEAEGRSAAAPDVA
jgi:Na+/H+-dicarboxylate symporter